MSEDNEKSPSQVTETPEATQSGAETPQVAVESMAESAPGMETEPKAEKIEISRVTAKAKSPDSERTYTHKEWAEREGAKDKETAALRNALAQQVLQAEIREAQTIEGQAQAADRQAVDGGEITPEQAQQRHQQRAVAWQQSWQERIMSQQQQQISHQVLMRAEEAGHILAAQDFAAKYKVDAAELLSDKTLTTPRLMEDKAIELRLERRRAELKALEVGEETFASGQMARGAIDEEKNLRSRYPTMFKK